MVTKGRVLKITTYIIFLLNWSYFLFNFVTRVLKMRQFATVKSAPH